jgi:hypothetical protein
VGVGSRGIANLATIVRAVVDYFTSAGLLPFIFPAMGSHGAASAEGQLSVLAHYGIDESAMGCPVKSTFNVVPLGRTTEGVETFAGLEAWESDMIFVVNRVKWHTSFAGPLESGLTKMIAIGLGKQQGAQYVHGIARKIGMSAAIDSAATYILRTGKILGGLAILEDAWHETAQVHVLQAATLIECERRLLETVKGWMARLPISTVDLLIVDEIGKNISGTGMDLKIVNRGTAGQQNPWPDAPRVERIFVRDLSKMSYGNGNGMGAADVVHQRLIDKLDLKAGRINALTSGNLGLVKTPLHFDTDRECFEVAAATVGKFDPSDVTVAWIRNTLEMGSIALSESLAEEARKQSDVTIGGPGFELKFDAQGNLAPLELSG